jgi:hypothetical protein
MSSVKHRVLSAAAIAVLFGVVGASQPSWAVTINFGVPPNGSPGLYTESGYQFDTANRDTGNCAAGSCDAIGSTGTLTKVGGGAFDLNSFYYYLNGNAELTLTPFIGNVAQTPIVLGSPLHTGTTYSTVISGVTSISFADTGNSTLRIDDLNVTEVTTGTGGGPNLATPLPAALPLFATGLGIVGFLARRRKRAA